MMQTPTVELKDTSGAPLVVGAMYCCVLEKEGRDGEPYDDHGALVRFIGVQVTPVLGAEGRIEHVFADADTWEQVSVDADKFVLQVGGAVDPSTKGWPAQL